LATPKDILTLRMARFHSIPSVIHYHMGRLPKIFEQKGMDWKLTRRAMLLADAVITLDEQSEKCIKEDLPEVRSLILPNMVEISHLDAIRRQADSGGNLEKTKRIVYVGQILPTKGIAELVQACGQQGEKNFVLELVGPISCEFKRHLTALASPAEAPEWLQFVGPQSHEQALQHIARADIFVLPSYTEGAPNVILEAMALGCGIVSTTVGAVPRMLDVGGPEECGICVPPRKVDALAQAIEKLLTNPEIGKKMGAVSPVRAKRLFDVPVACEQLAGLWKSLADRTIVKTFTSERRNTVLLVAPLPPPDYGGIANWSRIVRHALVESPSWSPRFIDTFARYRKVTNQLILPRLIGGTFHAFKTLWSIYKSIKCLHPTIMHLCTSGGLATPRNILSLLIAKHFGVPSLIHYRMGSLPRVFEKKGIEWRLTKRAMNMADVIITLDHRSEICVRECLPTKRVVVLPNMVEIDAIDAVRAISDPSEKKAEGFHVTFVGQILRTKGIVELVEACAIFADRGLHLDLVGPVSRSFHSKLTRRAAAINSADWLHFHGSKPHYEAVYIMAIADLIVLPSYSEGFPNVILEAMALGKPILASGVGAIPEMLDIGGEGECGVIVPPREVVPMATALERLMADPSLCLELGKKARRRVERLYSVPVACGQLTDLWESLLQSNKSE
jgi:glycosyltransferase involved in cell wall biosynthesis